MLPVEEVNAVPVLARVRQMTSINSILTIDLTGQACSHCLGPQTYSGLGGAFEFAYGAQLSTGARASSACRRGHAAGRAVVSNIVHPHPAGTRITIPEHCVDWVVTEYGAVRLKFLNLELAGRRLIEIAHPDVRDDLTPRGEGPRSGPVRLTRHRPPPKHFFARAT